MVEINLMKNYPITKRDVEGKIIPKNKKDILIARRFDKEFFDGDRKRGYGGYNYHPRFWDKVTKDMIDYYHLNKESKILDVGCAKGFMLYDFKKNIPELIIKGIDISEYAISNAKEEVKEYLSVGNAKDLSNFNDKEFDLVTSITTIHNLDLEECKQSLKEIERVGKNKFITVDAWSNDIERQRMNNWNLTAKTFMHINDWKKLFKEVGYTGDFYWFIP